VAEEVTAVTLPSFGHVDGAYLAWNALAFAMTFVWSSFGEWIIHAGFLHSRRIVSFAWKLHDQEHHVLFRGDATYESAADDPRTKHVMFVARDYALILLAHLPLFLAAEMLFRRPALLGGLLCVLAALQMFNSLHWRYHVPSDTWFQRTALFRFLKEHHRLHHDRTDRNLNVFFLPLADWCLGTLITRPCEVRR